MAEEQLLQHLREHLDSKREKKIEHKHGSLNEWKEFAEKMKI